MKTTPTLLCSLALLLGITSLKAATPMSADELLISPWDYEGQAVKLNVAFVKPTHFQSPLPDVIFYHAMTMTTDRRPGGTMLIAVPKAESERFARYYGLDPRGRNSLPLSGTLLLAHRPHPPHAKREHNPPAPTPAASDSSAEPTPAASDVPPADSTDTKPPTRPHRAGVWFVDYKGLSADLFSKHKDIELPEESGPVMNDRPPHEGPSGGPQGGGRRGPQGPPRR
jgi:hypothetical protein